MPKSKTFPHDASYKDFFSHPAMVASLLRDFVHEPFVPEMDFGTLERMSGEYVGKGFIVNVGKICTFGVVCGRRGRTRGCAPTDTSDMFPTCR